MISFKWYTGKSKLQGQKNRSVVARDWDGEKGKKATRVNLDYGNEHILVKIHRLNKKKQIKIWMYNWNNDKNETFQNKLLKVSNNFKMSSLFSALKMPHNEKVQCTIFSHNLPSTLK